jgi:hypothetical protein
MIFAIPAKRNGQCRRHPSDRTWLADDHHLHHVTLVDNVHQRYRVATRFYGGITR